MKEPGPGARDTGTPLTRQEARKGMPTKRENGLVAAEAAKVQVINCRERNKERWRQGSEELRWQSLEGWEVSKKGHRQSGLGEQKGGANSHDATKNQRTQEQ